SIEKPDTITPNQDVTLGFTIYQASSGNTVNLFRTVYEKPMHMIVVDDLLTYYSHIHPTQHGNTFYITTTFPHDGIYHIYVDFQPFGAIEQQYAFVVSVGQNPKPQIATTPKDTTTTKVFGNYEVTMQAPILNARDMTLGNQKITFILANAKT